MIAERVHVEGSATTANAAVAARKVALPPLPINGAWSINGQILAVDPAVGATRNQVQFNMAASGISIAGIATETDGVGPSAWPTQPAVNLFTSTVVTLVLNPGSPTVSPTAELEFTGPTLEGPPASADWFWELDVTLAT